MNDIERGALAPEPASAPASRGKEPSGGGARDLWDPRAINRYWLDAMSQAFDAWMRSPTFLKLMRQGLEMATAFPWSQDRAALDQAPASEPPSPGGEPESTSRSSEPESAPTAPSSTFHPVAMPASPAAASSPSPRALDSAPKGKRKIQVKGSKS
jgi:hypothetical protein